MRLRTLRLSNFRRLRNVRIDFENQTTIFVGPNNSGKTSVSRALRLFTTDSKTGFSIYDFNVACQNEFEHIANLKSPDVLPPFPTIALDLWFDVEGDDLSHVIDLIPNLDWSSNRVGLRLEFAPIDDHGLWSRFGEARGQAQEAMKDFADDEGFHPWPQSMVDYLRKNLAKEYEIRYFRLDPEGFDENCDQSDPDAAFRIVRDGGRSERQLLRRLLRVDFLDAQRYLSDTDSGARAEDISRRLSGFYRRHLEQHQDDYEAFLALSQSEQRLNEHLAKVFQSLLDDVKRFGYPGPGGPGLKLKTSLDPGRLMSEQAGTKLYHVFPEEQTVAQAFELPDRYDGLGFKNLIYMVVETLDLVAKWKAMDARPPLHVIFVEEPEVHLHAQLQQVFIRKIAKVLWGEDNTLGVPPGQLVLTTHSSHILFENGFESIRYFRKSVDAAYQESEVLNLSAFYSMSEEADRDFLHRYMRLTHCDLFFADAAILVEGNVERLLLPLMIDKAAPQLNSIYLTVLEVGGAYGHRFQSLLDFLALPVLIITDIDSIHPDSRKACSVHTEGARTSNQTLIQWLPGKREVGALLAATDDEKIGSVGSGQTAPVRVAYQTLQEVSWNDEVAEIAGRTFEEAFALENLQWVQDEDRKHLGLHAGTDEPLHPREMAERLFDKVNQGFKKVDFALGLIEQDFPGWKTPEYISEGLVWLENLLSTEMSGEVLIDEPGQQPE